MCSVPQDSPPATGGSRADKGPGSHEAAMARRLQVVSEGLEGEGGWGEWRVERDGSGGSGEGRVEGECE